MDDNRVRLLATIREIYGRVAWTHKTHEKQRELCADAGRRDKWINVVLTALTMVGVVVSVAISNPLASIIALLLALFSTLFAVYRLSFSPDSEAEFHRFAAKSLLIERDKLLLLIERSMDLSVDIAEIRKEVQKSTNRIGQIYFNAPDTTSKAYSMASKALKFNEELTFSSHEIDLLLPPELRLEEDKSSKAEGTKH